MESGGPIPISVNDALETLSFLRARTPTTTAEESRDAFRLLSTYGEGGVFVGHWAGNSEWERHTAGDEIVMVVEGETTIYFLTTHDEPSATLRAGEFVIVPEGTWHRFETPDEVKLLSVTPQPTDHSPDRPL
ncbi:MAG: cupin domain-containing protein [Ilumatobacteraceae bacterium]